MTLRYIIQRRLDLYVYDVSFIIMWAIQVVQSNLILLGEQMTCDYQNVLMFEANCSYFYLQKCLTILQYQCTMIMTYWSLLFSNDAIDAVLHHPCDTYRYSVMHDGGEVVLHSVGVDVVVGVLLKLTLEPRLYVLSDDADEFVTVRPILFMNETHCMSYFM